MDKETHKIGLIDLYENQKDGSAEFMKLVLDSAIHKLKNGIKPKKVEDWVIGIEKIWGKLL